MSYFASSASPEVAHWHDITPTHLIESIEDQITQSIDTLYTDTQELIVSAEHTIESIAEELGIANFAHQVSSNLTGCKLVLMPHGHLEIHREGMPYVTSFPITRRIETIS